MQNKPVVLIGAGGHAKVLMSLLRQQGINIIAIISPLPPQASGLFQGIDHYSHDSDISRFSAQDVELINGVGALPNQTARRRVFEHFTSLGFRFRSVIANSAIVTDDCQLAQGVQILPGAIVNVDTVLGDNVLINSGAIIEHDCQLQAHTVVSPGAILCGGVRCGTNAYIGAGATIIQGIQLGENTLAAAGSTVVHNLLDNQVIYCAKAFVKG